MAGNALFGLSVLMSFAAFGIVTKLYIWPRLRRMRRDEALLPLVVPHTFRFVGLSFLIPASCLPPCPRLSPFPPHTAIWSRPFLRSWRRSRFALAHPGPSRRVDLQCMGRRRPVARHLRGPDRLAHRHRRAGGGIFHPDARRAAAAGLARADFLAAAATEAAELGEPQ